MDHTPVTRVSYAGPTTCLRCDHTFQSWDRRHNRLCPSCRNVLKTQPSDETSYRAPTRRRLTPDDPAAAG
jgi:hypothetical protein